MLVELLSQIVQLILKRCVLERRQDLPHMAQTNDSRDLERLCEVCKNIYNCTLSILYQAIILGVAEEWELEDFDVERLRKWSTTNTVSDTWSTCIMPLTSITDWSLALYAKTLYDS